MSSGEHFLRLAAEKGFQAEALEKAVRLLELLEALSHHPFLKDRIALKGGTALNLFVFDTPRLSVDLERASRDLFDTRALLRESRLDWELLHFGFVVYGGVNRKDWRTITLEDVQADPRDVERQLLPMLRADQVPERSAMHPWSENLVVECRRLLAGLLPLRAHEVEFLNLLNDRGEVVPELLTGEAPLQAILHSHPGLKWKALSVAEYRRQRE